MAVESVAEKQSAAPTTTTLAAAPPTSRDASAWTPTWGNSSDSYSPIVYQLNVRVLLTELGASVGKAVTLGDIPDEHFKHLKAMGFDFIYLLGVWTTGAAGLGAAQRFMREHFPDVPKEEVVSSPFALCEYEVDSAFGGNEALKRLRQRLASHQLGLILDFVPNHVAFDHHWITAENAASPSESFILPGNFDLLRREPQNYFLVVEDVGGGSSGRLVMQGDDALHWLAQHRDTSGKKLAVLAHGRDPHFDGWRDTAQLNYFNPRLRAKMTDLLKKVSKMCDAVRCDMANLIDLNILLKTWGCRYREAVGHEPTEGRQFWKEAIRSVLEERNNFKFIAEVYWDMEGQLMDQGFHFCYDKALYDKLKHSDVSGVQHCLSQSYAHQMKLTRFTENHDEDRATLVYPDTERHRAAALLTYASLGMKFFHMGQLEGRVHRIPMQRNRYADPHGANDCGWFNAHVPDKDVQQIPAQASDMYLRLLQVISTPAIKYGKYYHCDVHSSGHGSTSHRGIVSFFRVPLLGQTPTSPSSSSTPSRILLIVVNYSNSSADGWVKVPHEVLSACESKQPQHSNPTAAATLINEFGGIASPTSIIIRDVFSSVESYSKTLSDMRSRGIWFRMKPWQSHVFEIMWR